MILTGKQVSIYNRQDWKNKKLRICWQTARECKYQHHFTTRQRDRVRDHESEDKFLKKVEIIDTKHSTFKHDYNYEISIK